jgi:hypothetical protein
LRLARSSVPSWATTKTDRTGPVPESLSTPKSAMTRRSMSAARGKGRPPSFSAKRWWDSSESALMATSCSPASSNRAQASLKEVSSASQPDVLSLG